MFDISVSSSVSYRWACSLALLLCFLFATSLSAADPEVAADGLFAELPASAARLSTSTAAGVKPLLMAEIVDQATKDHPQAQRIDATATGAHITCALQAMTGDLTPAGLNLNSTNSTDGRGAWSVRIDGVGRGSAAPMTDLSAMPGVVHVTDTCATLERAVVSEEVRTSAGGIRQDFLVHERPSGAGDLMLGVQLPGVGIDAVTSEQVAMTLDSGRQVVWHALQVSDAHGQQLVAAFEATQAGIAIRVDDSAAMYPIRIDPTFTDANWVSVGGTTGIVGDVNAAVIYNGDLVVGGDFHLAGTTVAHHVARWNGSRWSAFDVGANNIIYSLAASGNNLYAGGYFTMIGGVSANYIAKWNGSVWSAMGSGMNNLVAAIEVSGNDVYAGGSFSMSGGITTNYIAKWNGTAWSALGSGLGGGISALAVSGNVVYAGGGFSTAGGAPANRIAKWDGTTWAPMGSGISGQWNYVSTMAVSSTGDLYVGGDFIAVNGVTVNRIGKWDGSVWSAMGSGVSGTVNVIRTSGTDVYVGGYYTYVVNTPAAGAYIAKWDGNGWLALGNGISGGASALAISGSTVYVGGGFDTAGGIPVNSIAKLDGSSWTALGSGTSAAIVGIASLGTDVYVVGDFTSIAGTPAAHVAKWNGSAWSALGSGLNISASAVAVSNGNLYVGGSFTLAGDMLASKIAKWDGNTWSALGAGTNATVTSLAVSGNDVYAGGYFTMAGSVTASRIAKWNSTTSVWSAVGSGFDNTVNAIAIANGIVYAGGEFTNTGTTTPRSHIAQWNGLTWEAMGTGLNATVYAMATDGTSLYVGGNFAVPNTTDSYCVAKWIGGGWSQMGVGTNSKVWALVCSGTVVYAGGQFSTAGTQTVNRVAKWENGDWSNLGSGTNNANDAVFALGMSGSDLWAGGIFTTMGNKVSPFIAHTRSLGVTSQSMALTSVANQVYGAAPITLSATATSALPVSFRVTSGPGWLDGNVLTFSGTGTVQVIAEQDGNATFAPATSATWSIVVQPAPLQITAASTSRVFGTANPTFTGTISGLVNGDLVTATYASSATGGTAAGVYGPASAQAITPTVTDVSGRIANYSVTQTKGTLNITGSTVQTITIVDPGTVTYGAPVTLSASSTSSLPVTLSVVSGPATLSGAILTTTGAGSVVISAVQVGDVTYAQATTQRTITVQPAPLLATASAVSRLAGAANPTFTGTLTGVVGSDGITATYLSNATAATPAGVYDATSALAITPTLNDPNNRLTNYVPTLTKGTLTITSASEPPSATSGGDSGGGGGGCGLGGGTALVMAAGCLAMMRGRRR